MKVFVKTLKGTNFEIEVKPDDKVSDVKLNIESVQGADVYPAPQQMLIYQGKVLKDTTTLEENQVAENSFIVIMMSKTKAPPSGSSSATGPAASRPVTAVTPPSSTPQTPIATLPLPQPALVAAPTATAGGDVYGQAASNLVAGTTLESTVQQLLDMGGGSWDRDIVVRALRAAFNNPERAVEYLYSGIPEQAEIPAAAQVPVVGQPAVDSSVQAPEASQIHAGGPNANPLDLFPQGLPIPNMGDNFGPANFEVLRQSPQFQALRAMVQANPEILNPMLNELAKQNPGLLRLIQNNQAEFYRVINEPMERGPGHPLGPMPMMATPEEEEVYARLQAMGFSRLTVVQVYFACNKNEELAANYLLDHMHEFEDDEIA